MYTPKLPSLMSLERSIVRAYSTVLQFSWFMFVSLCASGWLGNNTEQCLESCLGFLFLIQIFEFSNTVLDKGHKHSNDTNKMMKLTRASAKIGPRE